MWASIRESVRSLARDDWVVGIAAAAAIALAVIGFVQQVVGLVLSAIDQPSLPEPAEDLAYFSPYAVKIWGRILQFEPLLASGLTLLGVVIVAALVVRRFRGEVEETGL